MDYFKFLSQQDIKMLDSVISKNETISSKVFGKKSTNIEEYLYIHTNFFIRLSECTSPMSFITAIHSYLRDMFGLTYSQFTRKYEKYVLSFIFLCLGVSLYRRPKKEGGNLTYAQGAVDKVSFKKILQDIRLCLSKTEQIKNSDFAKKFATFCSFLVCTPLFVKSGVDSTWLGFSELHAKNLQKEYNNTHAVNIALHIIDGATFITDKVILYLETGNYNAIYIDDKEIIEYEKDFDFLTYYSDKFALLANHEMSLDDYRRKVDETLETGKKLLSFYSADKYKAAILKKQQSALSRYKYRVDDKLCIKIERKAPISIVLYSAPGVGKSTLTDKLLHCLYENDRYLGVSSTKFDPKLKYVFNEDDEYMSEFKASHEVCIIDDIDQFNDDINLQKKGGANSKCIQFANTVAYVTNQANLEDKGMIPFTCKYVMKTTNSYDAGISKVFRPGGGAYRRDLFIETTVRDEYKKPGEQQLQGDLTEDGYKNHELHVFHVRKYKVLANKSTPVYWNDEDKQWYDSKTRCPTMTFAQLSRFLLEHVQKPHHFRGEHAKKSVEHFMDSEFCETCHVPSALCDCTRPQMSVDNIMKAYNCTMTVVENISSLIILCTIFQLAIYWLLHKICAKAYRNNEPNYFTKKVVVCIRKLPSRFGVPWWFTYLPMFLATRCLCDTWQDWAMNACKRAYGHGVLVQSIKHDLSKFYNKYSVGGTIALLGCLYTVVHLYSAIQPQSKPEVDENQSDSNYWSAQYENITRLSGPPSTVTFDQLVNSVELNCCHLIAENLAERQYHRICGLGLYGNVMALPKHFFDSLKDVFPLRMDIIRHDITKQGGPSRFKVLVDESCFEFDERYGPSDVIFFRHSALGTFRDVRKFLLPGMIKGKTSGTMVIRQRDGIMAYKDFEAMQTSPISYNDKYFSYAYNGYMAYTKVPTIIGECGAPYIVKTPNGCFIAGFHVGAKKATFGGRYKVFAACLINPDLDDSKFTPLSYNGVDLNEHYETVEDLSITQTQDKKCPIRLTDGGSMMMIGSINTHRRKMKTMVCHTIMAERVLQHYGKLDFTHFSPKGIKSSLACKQNVAPMFVKPSFPAKNIQRAEDALYAWFTRKIEEHKFFIPCEPYDIDVGVNGYDGASYIDRIPASTSGGFAHKGAKSKYLHLGDPEPGHTVKYELNDDIMLEFNRLKEKYLRGERGDIVWDFNFKDEPVSESKLLKQKCRIFNSGPLHFMIMVRMYYLWIIPLVSGKKRTEFGMAIGANAHGDDWTAIYEYITQHGKNNMIAGDYKAFDKNMPPELMTASFNVLIRICRDNGWSDEDLTIMRGLATDICYPLSNVFGTVVGMFGSNPSGHPLTTPINGMCNIMYMMLAAMDIEEERGVQEIDYARFQDSLAILTYGDDNCASSSIPWLNHTTISTALSKRGVTYTMADKESESVPFINVKDVDFLKRKFTPSVYVQGVIQAPLDEGSILKSLSVCTRSKTITFKEQCAQIISSANTEYFQYGKKKFVRENTFLNELLDEFDLRCYLPNCALKTFDELYIERFGEL